MRLYLETEGKIKTMISEKDNFVKFHSEGSPRFLDLTTSRLLDVRPRDPNISQNDAGVYVMTWDNRDPKIGPGDDGDDTATSPTFGLAFSVDGLNWTVYSNEMTIEGYPRDAGGDESCRLTALGSFRHVVPVFLTQDTLRLYFTDKLRRTGSGRGCVPGYTCSLGTAISN